jgi:ADP-heptose:LPS heptosyltransferase
MPAQPRMRFLERPFKHLLSAVLRFLLGSKERTLPANPSFRRILVVRQHNQLGDMLCVIPLLRSLRNRFPEAHIALLTSPGNSLMMEHCRYLDEIILYDKTRFLPGHWPRLGRFASYSLELRRRRWDLTIVPGTVSTSFTSDLLAWVSGAGTRIGVRNLNGRENGSSFFYNVPRDLDWTAEPGRHQTLRNVDIAQGLVPPPDNLSCDTWLTPDERVWGKAWVEGKRSGHSRSMVIHAGAGKAANRWPAERFARVAEALARECDSAIFISSGPMDSASLKELFSYLNVKAQVIDDKSIRELASVLSSVDLLVTNDTGVMHVGASVGTSVVSIFGPTDPRQWAPQGGRSRYIWSGGEDISRVTVEEVLAVARPLLTQGRN